MAITQFRPLSVNDAQLNRIQSNISEFADSVFKGELLQGQLLEDIALSTSPVMVDHKLGRAYRGWLIVNKNAESDVWVSGTTLPRRFLTLTASATVTVSLWVF